MLTTEQFNILLEISEQNGIIAGLVNLLEENPSEEKKSQYLAELRGCKLKISQTVYKLIGV